MKQVISTPTNKIDSNNHIVRLRRQISPILREHGVTRASLIGSFARGEETDTSDLDVLVEFKKGKSLLDLVGLKPALENKTGRRVDVVTYRALHPLLRESI